MPGTTVDGIAIERDFKAPPSRVFAAWTSAESFAQWFGGAQVNVPAESLTYDAVEGTEWRAVMELPDGNTIHWVGDFVNVEPYSHVALTITDVPDSPVRSLITVDLKELEGGTRMHFTQETPGFSQEQKKATVAGWQGFLDVLEQIALA